MNDVLAIPYIPAKYYTHVASRGIELLVIHDMEYPERPNGAEWCAQYFHAPNSPRASAHYYVDNNSIVQGVRNRDIAWAAPGANHNGIQIEHAGYAAQSRAQWLDAYSRSELRLSAKLAAHLCIRYSIPVRHVTAAGLKKDWAGITGHRDVNEAFHKSDHSDPGPNFPWPFYLRAIREEVSAIRHAERG